MRASACRTGASRTGKYTDLRALMRECCARRRPGRGRAEARRRRPEAACHRRRAQAGAGGRGVAPSLSETGNPEKGLLIRTLREVFEAGGFPASGPAARHPKSPISMVALNGAMMTDGLVIELADGAALMQPLHIVHIAAARSPRDVHALVVQLGKDAGATLWKAISPPTARQPIRPRCPACLDRRTARG